MKNSSSTDRSNPHNPLRHNSLLAGEVLPYSLESMPISMAEVFLELAQWDLNGKSSDALCFAVSNQIRWLRWRQIANHVATIIDTLGRLSLRRHAHIASQLPNGIAWISIDLACQILGHTHVAMDIRWPTATTEQMIIDAKCDVIVTQDQIGTHSPTQSIVVRPIQGDKVEVVDLGAIATVSIESIEEMLRAARKVDVQSPAQILFTSGTSGMPKAVLLSHRNLVSNALAKLDAAPQSSHDLRLNILPFCHAYARTCELSTWILTGGRIGVATSWNNFLQMAPAIQPTLVNLVPHLVNKLAEQNTNAQSLRGALGGRIRLLQVGGAAISEPTWHRFAEAGIPPLQGYGLTEASPVVCSNRAGNQRPGTIGWPVRGVETKLDSNGQLWARGENVMLGYFNDPSATAERIQDGWLATGDLAEQDAEGQLRIIGRADHRIVLSTGLKVSPEVIESRLMVLPDIEQIVVVGTNQSFLLALVWLKSTVDERELEPLIAELLSQMNAELLDLPEYMRPKRCKIVSFKIPPEMLSSKGQLIRQKAIEVCHSIIDDVYRSNRNS